MTRPAAVPSAGLAAEVERWIDADPDEADRAELAGLLAAAAGGGPDAGRAGAELAGRFGGRLRFGTAGLRARVGAGPMRLNRAVVRATTAGVAAWLLATVPDAARRGVAVGCDGRHRSRQLWEETARTLAGAGITVHLLPPEQPTPLLAFATRHLGAVAGVMVTASHNPAPDNGYKLYLDDGAQVVAPHDAAIEAAIAAVGDLGAVPVGAIDDPLVRPAGREVIDAYVAAVVAQAPRPAGARALRVVHTAMHGVSSDLVAEAVAAAGHDPVVSVGAQARPDPDFPTVRYPNPEEPGALDLALALAVEVDADLVVANDPDGDRLAVACPFDGGWRVLSGDELGAVLASGVLDGSLVPGGSGAAAVAAEVAAVAVVPVVAASLVSSGLVGSMAAAAGVTFVETLTGFKWIARAADGVGGGRLAFGYEEALGYAVGDAVRDKDGVGALLAVLALAAVAGPASPAEALLGRLDAAEASVGVHATRQVTRRLASPEAAARVVAALRAAPPSEVGGLVVRAVEDLAVAGEGGGLPPADVVVWRLDGGRVVVRPSGTEPKLKAYLEVLEAPDADLVGARARARATLDRLEAGVVQLLDGGCPAGTPPGLRDPGRATGA